MSEDIPFVPKATEKLHILIHWYGLNPRMGEALLQEFREGSGGVYIRCKKGTHEMVHLQAGGRSYPALRAITQLDVEAYAQECHNDPCPLQLVPTVAIARYMEQWPAMVLFLHASKNDDVAIAHNRKGWDVAGPELYKCSTPVKKAARRGW